MKMTRKNIKNRLFLKEMFFILFIFLIGGSTAMGAGQQDTTRQDTLMEEAPNVYLDCHFYCDQDHIKREIDYVNYVRDRKDADVHIMITSERAANEGRRYSVFMLGQNGFVNLQDTLRFNVGPDASEEQSRQKLLHALRSGLTPYLLKTPMWQNLAIDYNKPAEEEEVKDKWNYWIFELSADGEMRGEESRKGYEWGGRIEANKVTKDIKLEFDFDADYDRNIYEVNDRTITSIHRTYDFDALSVWSLSQHWSAGGFAGLRSSRFQNIAISYNASPAIEFNIFPYMEATTRQLTILYRPGFRYNVYSDTTIFNKTEEDLLRESLEINYDVKQKWGSIDLSLEASHYFHDFSKNRLSFRTFVNVNVVKGLNVYLMGGASLIHDQLSLRKGDATAEEILTRQRELATNYEYFTRFGISYTFGSMYNNIVNSRF
jgi:hypothetical protein